MSPKESGKISRKSFLKTASVMTGGITLGAFSTINSANENKNQTKEKFNLKYAPHFGMLLVKI